MISTLLNKIKFAFINPGIFFQPRYVPKHRKNRENTTVRYVGLSLFFPCLDDNFNYGKATFGEFPVECLAKLTNFGCLTNLYKGNYRKMILISINSPNIRFRANGFDNL